MKIRCTPGTPATDVLSVSTDAHGIITSCSTGVGDLLGRPRSALLGHPVPMDVFDREQLAQRAAAAGVPSGPGLFLVDPRRFDRRRDPGPELVELDRRRAGPADAPCTSTCDADEGPGTICSWNVTTTDGGLRVISLTVQAILGDEGIVGYVARGVDVTEEHRTSRMLAQALLREQEVARRHAELDRLRNDFVSNASHELRTPLTNIRGFVELLEDGIEDPERRSRYISTIRRNVVRLQGLAESLAVLSSVGADRESSRAPLDLRDVVEAVRAIVHSDDSSVGVLTELVCPGRPVTVLGDASRLELAVLHLVENALKFTAAGGLVSCRVETSDDEARIVVTDTGPGVPSSDVPYLFSPFFRGAAAQRDAVPGSGLGLSIVAAVVEEHGGRLLVSDNHPQGMVFTLRLPRSP